MPTPLQAPATRPVPPPPPPAAAKPEPTVEPTTQDHFPIGWQLTKESWHFHRLFRRPMRQGEYSHLQALARLRAAMARLNAVLN